MANAMDKRHFSGLCNMLKNEADMAEFKAKAESAMHFHSGYAFALLNAADHASKLYYLNALSFDSFSDIVNASAECCGDTEFDRGRRSGYQNALSVYSRVEKMG